MELSSSSRALIVGHFSTFGDLEVLSKVEDRLHHIGVEYDVVPYSSRIQARTNKWINTANIKPAKYSHVVVVCGPFSSANLNRNPDIFLRLQHCVWVGVNLTMIESSRDFNPFQVLLERDSDRTARPDISFAHEAARVPVVGLCLVHPQAIYGNRQRHDHANAALRALIERSNLAVIELDTAWPSSDNAFGLRSPAEFESVVRRIDVMLTTRLHGMVLSLKNGIPVIAIDAIKGGAKVSQQANAVGWSEIFAVESVSDEDLILSLARCLQPGARARALQVASHAKLLAEEVFDAFDSAMNLSPKPYKSTFWNDLTAGFYAFRRARRIAKYKR